MAEFKHLEVYNGWDCGYYPEWMFHNKYLAKLDSKEIIGYSLDDLKQQINVSIFPKEITKMTDQTTSTQQQGKKRGKPLSAESAQLRDALLAYARSKQTPFKASDITSDVVGDDTQDSTISNNLRALAKQGLLREVGKDESYKGRGRKPVLFQIN